MLREIPLELRLGDLHGAADPDDADLPGGDDPPPGSRGAVLRELRDSEDALTGEGAHLLPLKRTAPGTPKTSAIRSAISGVSTA